MLISICDVHMIFSTILIVEKEQKFVFSAKKGNFAISSSYFTKSDPLIQYCWISFTIFFYLLRHIINILMMNACLLIYCWLHWWFFVIYTDYFLLFTLIYTTEEQQTKHVLTMHEVNKGIKSVYRLQYFLFGINVVYNIINKNR